ncbi:MAG: hypothetical protein Alpg2KO_01060 [Alphaproteobacteria bacterium]
MSDKPEGNEEDSPENETAVGDTQATSDSDTAAGDAPDQQQLLPENQHSDDDELHKTPGVRFIKHVSIRSPVERQEDRQKRKLVDLLQLRNPFSRTKLFSKIDPDAPSELVHWGESLADQNHRLNKADRELDSKLHQDNRTILYGWSIRSIMIVVTLILLMMMMAWAWHILAWKGGHWLTPDQFSTLQGLLFGIVSFLLGDGLNKFRNKLNPRDRDRPTQKKDDLDGIFNDDD